VTAAPRPVPGHPECTIASSADVAPDARLGAGTKVWHLAQVGEGARLGRSCVVGRGAYVGPRVQVGDHVKIQNYALVYAPAEIGRGAFVGPAVVLTNDQHPRAIDPDGRPKGGADWTPVGVVVGEGASLGARAVCVAPVRVGRWAMVGAGAVVVRDVPDHALVVGVPARRVGWVGRAGVPLVSGGNGTWRCPRTGERYRDEGDKLYEIG
jgi:UDP-2-acetamido-3-amino-2,3-dideoxy-glucuronate N-acetyltransferase